MLPIRVATNSPGFKLESVVKLYGHAGGDEGALVWKDLHVTPDQLVGKLHEGFGTALLGVSLGRIYNTARAVGLARWSLELAFNYAQQREAFGHPIADYQGVTFPLAEFAMELHAAHLMGINAAALLDRGERAIKELSMAKCYAVEAGLRAVDRAVQTHGGTGSAMKSASPKSGNPCASLISPMLPMKSSSALWCREC
jgi:acyl-CoA dehydrogenase